MAGPQAQRNISQCSESSATSAFVALQPIQKEQHPQQHQLQQFRNQFQLQQQQQQQQQQHHHQQQQQQHQQWKSPTSPPPSLPLQQHHQQQQNDHQHHHHHHHHNPHPPPDHQQQQQQQQPLLSAQSSSQQPPPLQPPPPPQQPSTCHTDRSPHVEIVVDPSRRNCDVEQGDCGGGGNIIAISGRTSEHDEGGESRRESVAGSVKKHRHHKHRSLYRRFFNYIRNAWTGVHFSSSNDSELEELEQPPRYRPDSLSALCRATRFSESEIKRIYRGFKAECPTGVVKEDTFKVIYAQFFPQGANTGLYAHYVFNTLDQDHSGIVSFEEFVQGLSVLSRGSMEEKLRWTFSLYDINGDGFITRDEMTDIVTAIYELMGRMPSDAASPDEEKIKEKVEKIFLKMDVNGDGVVTLDEFLECCRNDDAISRSMAVFDTAF